MNTTIDTTPTNVSCDCGVVRCVGVTITVPASMLVNPKPGAKTTPRYLRTVIHNLVQNRDIFRYREV